MFFSIGNGIEGASFYGHKTPFCFIFNAYKGDMML
jgi:hypothetical protein